MSEMPARKGEEAVRDRTIVSWQKRTMTLQIPLPDSFRPPLSGVKWYLVEA